MGFAPRRSLDYFRRLLFWFFLFAGRVRLGFPCSVDCHKVVAGVQRPEEPLSDTSGSEQWIAIREVGYKRAENRQANIGWQNPEIDSSSGCYEGAVQLPAG